MSKYPIEKCKTCDRYNHQEHRRKNKLRCMFTCDEYMEEMARRAMAYNIAVSGEDFGTHAEYEHGTKVFGSDWKCKLK